MLTEQLRILKLAAEAIPYSVTQFGLDFQTTSSTTFVLVPGMSVTITLNRASGLIIMFGGRVYHTGTAPYYLYLRAFYGTAPPYSAAYPDSDFIILTQSTEHSTHSFTYYTTIIAAGTYTVQMHWRVWQTNDVGNVVERTLIVIALPA